MNQSNKNTDDILDAIKSMMSSDQLNSEQHLPKEIIELTKPVDEKKVHKSETGILELTELAVDEVLDEKLTSEVKDLKISEDQIRAVVRNTIETLPLEITLAPKQLMIHKLNIIAAAIKIPNDDSTKLSA